MSTEERKIESIIGGSDGTETPPGEQSTERSSMQIILGEPIVKLVNPEYNSDESSELSESDEIALKTKKLRKMIEAKQERERHAK